MLRYFWMLFLFVTFNFNDVSVGLSLPESHTCVIGAGYSGLAAARYLKEFGLNFTVLEASRHIGGTWRFDPNVGYDEDGVPVFTSQYKHLRTNTPRQTMEFGGYPFPDNTPSYPTGTCFYKYLKSFVKHFNLTDNIQVCSYVNSVRWDHHHWVVTYLKTDERDAQKNVTIYCDFVIVASGQYVKPNMPRFPGLDTFKGSVIHSHDYKDPELYKGRRVLLVGAGASGLDLSIHLQNVTAKLVHSHHLKYNQPKFGSHYLKKPDIKTFVSDGVIFTDGTFEEIDDAIFCTGFRYSHPFLDHSTGVTATEKFVLPLYQTIVNIRHPSMMFLGVINKIITRAMDVQAEYAVSHIAGKFKLPSQEEMLKIWLQRVYDLQNKKMKITDINTIGSEMDQYFANLTAEAGITRVPPVLTTIRDFNGVNRLEDLLNYREYDYEIIDPYNYKRTYNGGGRRGLECPINI